MAIFERCLYGLIGLACVAPAIAAEPVVLHTQVVIDQQGFQEEALRLLVPKGWRFEGGVTWDVNRFPAEAFTRYTVSSPDGRAVYEQFAHTSLFWSDDQMLQYGSTQNGLPIAQPMGAEQALRELYLANYRPQATDAQVVEAHALPELAQQALQSQQMLMNVFARISPLKFQYELRADAAHLRFRYSESGKPMSEDVTAVIVYFIAYMPTVYGPVPAITWSVAPTSFRAPAAEMDKRMETFRVIAASVRNNPAWHEHMMKLAAVITNEQLRQQKAIFQRLDQIRQSQSEMSDELFASWQRRSQAQDRIFDRYSQSIRGVETYSDPMSSRQVELPHGYRHAWSNGTDYVLSDDAGLNPNAIGGGTWTEIHPAR